MLQILKNNLVFKSAVIYLCFCLSFAPSGFSQTTATQTTPDNFVPTQGVDSGSTASVATKTNQEPKDFMTDNSSVITPVKTTNAAVQAAAPQSSFVYPESTPPTGTIKINANAVYAASPVVVLSLTAKDTGGSGLAGMSFSQDGGNTWTPEEGFASSKQITLSGGDGNKTVLVKFTDKARNFKIYSESIILDTQAPTGTLKVNGGAEAISQRLATLNLTAADAGSGVSKMRFSRNGATWTAAEAFAETKSWDFLAGDGNKTVYVQYQDKTGKWSSAIALNVIQDSTKPSGSVIINSGAEYTNSQTVTLNFPAAADTGSGIAKVAFSNDGGKNWSVAEEYKTSMSINLPAPDGAKTIQVMFFDKAGNASATYSDTIILDQTPPVVVPVGLPKDGKTDSAYYILTYSVQDQNTSSQRTQVLNLQPGMNTFTVMGEDAAGNKSPVTVSLEYTPLDFNLTPEERILRDRYVQENIQFFISGKGIDPQTGFPVDFINTGDNSKAAYTQPTAIGFYLNILGQVMTKRLVVPGLTQEDAILKAGALLSKLQSLQQYYQSWNGLFPWFRLNNGKVESDINAQDGLIHIGLIDNANLTSHIACLMGAIEESNMTNGAASRVHQLALEILEAQQEGYRKFVDPATGTFHSEYILSKSRQNGVTNAPDFNTRFYFSHADRFGSEVRSAIPFLIEFSKMVFSSKSTNPKAIPDTVWTNLIRSEASYTTQQGNTVTTFSTFDGGAFQYFWGLLNSPEESLPNVKEALQNALTIFTDIMQKNNLSGFPSAASLPSGGYEGSAGINVLKENQTQQDEMMGAVYALASAYRLNPSLVLAQLQAIEQKFPALKGSFGFFDSMKNGLVSKSYYAIDQGAFVLGLLGTGGSNMRTFLESRLFKNHWDGYQSYYANLDLSKSPNLFAGASFSGAGGVSVTPGPAGIFSYTKTSAGYSGTPVSLSHSANYEAVTIKIRSANAGSVRLELKNGSEYVLKQDIELSGNGEWQVIQLLLPAGSASINYLAFADATSNFDFGPAYFTNSLA